jgi:hypothetical protein
MNMRRRSRRDARDAKLEADLALTVIQCEAGRTTAIGIAAAYLGRPHERQLSRPSRAVRPAPVQEAIPSAYHLPFVWAKSSPTGMSWQTAPDTSTSSNEKDDDVRIY